MWHHKLGLSSVVVGLAISHCLSAPPSTAKQDESEPGRGNRTWSDATGKFSTTAEFTSLADGSVVLKKENGKSIQVPLQRLSNRDQAVIEYFTAPKHDSKSKLIIGFMVSDMDGDTFLCKDLFDREWTVRLDGIDAPENSQPYGLDARRALRRTLLNKKCYVEWTERDRYRRILGRVFVESPVSSDSARDVNLSLVGEGLAWNYTKYSKDILLANSERYARGRKKGIWKDSAQIAPWDWRNGVRRPTAKPVNVPSIRTIDVTVFITETGKKYHKDGCRFLKKSKISIPLTRAKSAYDACKVCNPPH